MKKRRKIWQIMFWFHLKHPIWWFLPHWARFVCWFAGHKKPYVQKISAEICGRCNAILRYPAPINHRLTVNRAKSHSGPDE